MKKLFTLLTFLFIASNLFAQKSIYFESGASASPDGFSLNISVNYFKTDNFVGFGFNAIGIMNYNGIKKSKILMSPIFSFDYNTKSIEERGPYGLGGGIRILSKYGLGIEVGYIATWHSKYSIFDIPNGSLKYAWEENKFKGYPYGRFLIYDRENKFTLGFGLDEIQKGSLYLGYKF